jgi:hypothetical protein
MIPMRVMFNGIEIVTENRVGKFVGIFDGLGLGAGLSVGNLEILFVGTEDGERDGFNDLDGIMEGDNVIEGTMEGNLLGLGLGAGDSVGNECP